MKTRTFLLAALALALLPVSARQSLPASPSPAWIQEFNNLPETTRKNYIAQFRKAEQLFAQKRIMECLFSLMELEKLYAGNPGLYNLRGACYIEIRNIEKALENFEKAQKLDPSNLTIQFNLAEAHYVNHDYSRALKAFTELLLPFKDNPGMTPLLQFKRYICARKLDNQPLAAELEKLYGPMDDTPYYYCTQAILKLMEGDKEAAQGQLLSAIRRHQRHPGLHGRHDGGWHPSLPLWANRPNRTAGKNRTGKTPLMNAEATVLKLYPLGENGLIAVWCTEEGLIRTAAKSARKPCSPFAGRLDIFYQCRMQWTQAKKGDLHTLTSADLLSPRLALRKSYLRLSAAGYFARLFLQMLEPDTPIPEFYDLLQRAYTYLENNDPTLRAVLHFEQELARLHGIAHPGIPAHVILKSHFGKLPSQREKLLGSLEQKES